MTPDQTKLIAKMQHFYDLIQQRRDESEAMAVIGEDKDKYKAHAEAMTYIIDEYNKIFGEMLYTESL